MAKRRTRRSPKHGPRKRKTKAPGTRSRQARKKSRTKTSRSKKAARQRRGRGLRRRSPARKGSKSRIRAPRERVRQQTALGREGEPIGVSRRWQIRRSNYVHDMGTVSRALNRVFETDKKIGVNFILDCKLKDYPAGLRFTVVSLKQKRFNITVMNDYLPIGAVESLAGGLDIFEVLKVFLTPQMRFQVYKENPAKDMPKIFHVTVITRFNL